MYAVVKRVTKIEIQEANRNYIFFFGKKGLAEVNWLSVEFNPLIAFVFLSRGAFGNGFSSKS
jgi:hypothetical protein